MAKRIQCALIGQAFMGRAHSNAYRQAKRFFDLAVTPELHTISARDETSLKSFAAKQGWENWTTDWRDLCTNDSISYVDVATPNHLHREMCVELLKAGKHVACEKPLASSLDDARAMRDAARKAKSSKTFVWFNYRRAPAVSLAWKLLRQKRLGKIFHVRASYLQSWGGPETPMSWRFKKNLAGSGAHGDLNAHIVDLARFLLGEEIAEVHGAIERTFVKSRRWESTGKNARSDVDDVVMFLASFNSGATASFEATRLAKGHLNDNTIEINGELGSLRWNLENLNELWLHEEAENPGESGWRRIVATDGAEHPYSAAWWPEGHIIGYEHTFTNQVSDIMRVLAGKKPVVPLPDFADAYQTQRVLEAALVSARERRAVKLKELS
jgi:predicted dehydrogenase